jgi:DNA (cytosine-5)-methyltransferase 1
MTIKILNLYAGIGGNRKLWTGDIEVTAVENVPEIAKIYQDFFPNDKVIIVDAHQYLLEHFKEFDFIWSSPPCPSHSRVRRIPMQNGKTHPFIYPDMNLYQEIILLMFEFKGKYVVENVRSYYEPLIKPIELERHYFWSNFPLSKKEFETLFIIREDINERKQKRIGFDLSKYKGIDKTKVLRNCVNPLVGLHIFNMAFKEPQLTLDLVAK